MFTKRFYMWGPRTHGPLTFGVVARSEKKAHAIVDEYIRRRLQQPVKLVQEGGGISEYNCEGWKTGDYALEVFKAGEVMTHPND